VRREERDTEVDWKEEEEEEEEDKVEEKEEEKEEVEDDEEQENKWVELSRGEEEKTELFWRMGGTSVKERERGAVGGREREVVPVENQKVKGHRSQNKNTINVSTELNTTQEKSKDKDVHK